FPVPRIPQRTARSVIGKRQHLVIFELADNRETAAGAVAGKSNFPVVRQLSYAHKPAIESVAELESDVTHGHRRQLGRVVEQMNDEALVLRLMKDRQPDVIEGSCPERRSPLEQSINQPLERASARVVRASLQSNG